MTKKIKNFLNNKKGIELTINFVVILIIGVAMLSGALMMTSRLFTQAEKYKATVDAQTQSQIRNLITDSDDLVVIYPPRRTIPRSKSYIFGVGVQNTIKAGEGSDKFALSIKLSKALDPDGEDICQQPFGNNDDGFNCEYINQDCEEFDKPADKKKCFEETWIIQPGPLEIKKNSIETFAVPITVSNKYANKGMPSGLYIFNVCICTGPDPECPDECDPGSNEGMLYGPINKIYVRVT